MSNYRDEREALRARSEALQAELDEKQGELDQMRGGESARRRIEQLERDLASAQQELGDLRRELRPPQHSPARPLALAGTITLVVFGAVGALFLVTKRAARSLPLVPPVSSPYKAPAPIQPPRAEPVPPEPADHAVSTSFEGTVKTATGAERLAPGTKCRIRLDAAARVGTTQISRVDVLCGTRSLYSSDDEFSGMSNLSGHVDEETGPESDTYRHRLVWEDIGTRSGRNQASIDTRKRQAMIWHEGAGAFNVEIDIAELGEPQKTSLDPKAAEERAQSRCPTYTTAATVIDVTGDYPLKPGAACKVTVSPANKDSCRVQIGCGDRPLYGDGSSVARLAARGALEDFEPSKDDKDPKLMLDFEAQHAVISDEAVTSWSVTLRLATKPPKK